MSTRRTSTRLEIGGGPHPLPGFDAVTCEWGSEPLPCASGSADLIYASHVLEHVRWHEVPYALGEAYRVLAHGGALEVWVPDLAYLAACYLAGVCGDDWRRMNAAGDPWAWLNGRLFGYGPADNLHKSAFDSPSLNRLLLAAGFAEVYRLTTPRGYDHGRIGLGMRAVK